MKPKQVLEIFAAFQKRNEPKSIAILRILVAILFLAILICYMYVQIVDVRLDTPIFSVKMQDTIEEEEIPMPSKYLYVHFAYGFQFNINCQIIGRINKTSLEDCEPYLQQPESSSTNGGIYEGVFEANGLNFTKFDIEKIEFNFTIIDPNVIPLDDDSDIGIKIQIFDSKTQDPLNMKNYKEDNNHVKNSILSLTDLNSYHLSSHEYHIVELSRIKRNVAKEYWWNILGIPPKYIYETFINSQLESHPLLEALNAPANSYAKLALIMRTWRVPLEQEQKAKTLFDAVGQIAGVVGSLSFLYSLLFGTGSNAIQSWGIVQKMKWFGIKKERLDAVERFLKEYVVDADFLAQLEKLDKESNNSL
ncbi:9400_t:CDS:10 [Rhizophagus irregularis]|nr:9400_t:CDS:10 [Rhizophagus irregularis]